MIVVATVVGVSVDTVAISPLWSGVSFFVTMLAVWVFMQLVPVVNYRRLLLNGNNITIV